MALPGGTDYDLFTLTNPGSALTDFTLIIDLANCSADFKSAWNTNDNGRGRAAIHGSGTELACDLLPGADYATGTGNICVKWSGTFASSGTQQLRLYPPNTDNSQYAAADTYGSDNAYKSTIKGYWPEGGNLDRTANGNNATRYGTYSEIAGQIGIMTDYGGSSTDYARASDAASLEIGGAMSILFWIDPDDVSSRQSIIQKYDTSGDNRSYMLEIYSGTYIGLYLSSDGVNNYYDFHPNNLSVGTKRHIALTWTKSNRSYISENGGSKIIASVGSGLANITNDLYDGTAPLDFARSTYSTTRALDGALGQIFIFSENVSEAWIAYEYAQTNDNASQIGSGTWQGGGVETFSRWTRRRRRFITACRRRA